MRNMTDLERVIRFVAGALCLALGIALLALPASGALAIVLWLAVLALGLDLVVTGAVGYCPLYRYFDVPWAGRHRS